MADDIKNLDNPQVIPIFRERINFAKNVGIDFLQAKRILEFPATIKEVISDSPDSPRRYVFGFTFTSKARENSFLIFWAQQLGCAKVFWFPSHTNDFMLRSNIIGSTFTITVDYNFFDRVRKGHERCYFLLNDGSLITRKITDYQKLSFDTAELTLQDTVGTPNILLTDIQTFGFFHLGRFSSDSLKLSHVTSTVSEARVMVHELIKEYP